jgi:hypothetical protein
MPRSRVASTSARSNESRSAVQTRIHVDAARDDDAVERVEQLVEIRRIVDEKHRIAAEVPHRPHVRHDVIVDLPRGIVRGRRRDRDPRNLGLRHLYVFATRVALALT